MFDYYWYYYVVVLITITIDITMTIAITVTMWVEKQSRGQGMKVRAGPEYVDGGQCTSVGARMQSWGLRRVGGGRDASVRARGCGLGLGTCERGP